MSTGCHALCFVVPSFTHSPSELITHSPSAAPMSSGSCCLLLQTARALAMVQPARVHLGLPIQAQERMLYSGPVTEALLAES